MLELSRIGGPGDLRQESVIAPGARLAGKGAPRKSRHVHARPVSGDGDGLVGRGCAELAGPQDVPGRVVLLEERVVRTGARLAGERTLREARQVYAGPVGGDALRVVVPRRAEL